MTTVWATLCQHDMRAAVDAYALLIYRQTRGVFIVDCHEKKEGSIWINHLCLRIESSMAHHHFTHANSGTYTTGPGLYYGEEAVD